MATSMFFALSSLAVGQQYGGPGYVPPAGGYKASTGLIIGGVAAAGGVLAFLLLHHSNSVTGCVAAAGAGKTLTTSDGHTYALDGDAASLPVGERLKLSGKQVTDPSGSPSFEVNKVAQDLGACS